MGWMNLLRKYQGEIESLKQQVAELSWDEPFGMLTRTAFLQYCRRLQAEKKRLVFIDLDDIGALNFELGYAEVDRRVRSVFALAPRYGVTVARWYSGDEIVLLLAPHQDLNSLLYELQAAAWLSGLSFAWAAGEWDASRQSIEEAVERVANLIPPKKALVVEPGNGGGRRG